MGWQRGRFWGKSQWRVNQRFVRNASFSKLWRLLRNTIGLSGLGDVLLSCSSRQSRNFLFGELLGNGNGQTYCTEKIGVLLRAGLAPPPS